MRIFLHMDMTSSNYYYYFFLLVWPRPETTIGILCNCLVGVVPYTHNVISSPLRGVKALHPAHYHLTWPPSRVPHKTIYWSCSNHISLAATVAALMSWGGDKGGGEVINCAASNFDIRNRVDPVVFYPRFSPQANLCVRWGWCGFAVGRWWIHFF